MKFPVDITKFKKLSFSFSIEQKSLSPEQKKDLLFNINLIREAIVFMTAYSNKKGLGGHTGGAYDIVPELLIINSFLEKNKNIYPVHYDDAGHRVAIQYVMAAVNGHIPADQLLHYREFNSQLPGHPEVDVTPGIKFSSGRLGHLWSYVNGLALANPDKTFIIYSSDGAQQEGNNAEAARFAVSQNLNIKIIVDDNDVTIGGHTSDYIKGFDIEKTLSGHGISTSIGEGENIDDLFIRIQNALNKKGPFAIINKRKMAPGIEEIEGTIKGHDAIAFTAAEKYLQKKGNHIAIKMLETASKNISTMDNYRCSTEFASNRKIFGQIICQILEQLTPEELQKNIRVIDSDLAGSVGLDYIKEKFPEIFIQGGIMERNNFSVAAGFGSRKGAQGIFSTFAAFQEMIISEITMARLNKANILAHMSHSGVDGMADNTCHFGLNNYFSNNTVEQNNDTKLYYPADACQMEAIVKYTFNKPGIRFIYSTRSSVPYILNKNGDKLYDINTYQFTEKDDLIIEGSDGYIVSYGEMLYRSLSTIKLLKEKGISIGLINKACLNIVDEDMMKKLGKTKNIIVIESQNRSTGLGIRFGNWLLERNYSPNYNYLGTTLHGNCGQEEQIIHQNLHPEGIVKKILKSLK